MQKETDGTNFFFLHISSKALTRSCSMKKQTPSSVLPVLPPSNKEYFIVILCSRFIILGQSVKHVENRDDNITWFSSALL
jgi:hypothetical protein